MRLLFKSLKELDPVLSDAIDQQQLQVLGTGSSSPCLDLLRISDVLADAALTADFVVIEVK